MLLFDVAIIVIIMIIIIIIVWTRFGGCVDGSERDRLGESYNTRYCYYYTCIMITILKDTNNIIIIIIIINSY